MAFPTDRVILLPQLLNLERKTKSTVGDVAWARRTESVLAEAHWAEFFLLVSLGSAALRVLTERRKRLSHVSIC